MTAHNQAQPGDYAPAVLLPGDPLRAQWIATEFLTDARCVNSVRGALGFTGTYRGRPVSVQATGMGQPSISIYVHELVNEYGARKLIRIGTAGGLNLKVHLRDLILAQAVTTDSALLRDRFGTFSFAPIADFQMLRRAADLAAARGIRAHVGNLASSDVFYDEAGLEVYEPLIRHGVLGVEMEAAALYLLAARFGVRALAIVTMTDCLISAAELTAQERQTSLRAMVEIALEVAVTDDDPTV